MTIEPPKDLAAATRLLERIAKLDARIAGRHATRVALIAKINAAADKLLVPALAQRERLVELLKPWWSSDEAKAARGTAKSMVLGGCKIGTKESPASLTYGGKAEDFGLAQLRAEKWAKPLITVSYSVNKTAVREALKAKRSDELIAMGFGEKQDTVFFVTSVSTLPPFPEHPFPCLAPQPVAHSSHFRAALRHSRVAYLLPTELTHLCRQTTFPPPTSPPP
ncbi:hypothetical protein DAH70_09130, partial [Sphingomonas koreensis]|uniref:host-nuclease inhibitor Gam family protein n=1 Tax=Sphingomonas koreensis TaxID=93064 RepID=UPI0010012D95